RFASFLLAAISGPGALGARRRRAPEVSDACSYPSCSLEDLAMRTYNISPLWRRSTIGFDRFLDLADGARHGEPPCNVERLSGDRYRISLALAGFSPDDIALTAEQNVLTVEGRKADRRQHELL